MSDYDFPLDDATEDSPAVEMTADVAPVRNANDGYAFAAIICAIAGFVIPILPAAAALLLVRATEAPIADQPLSPNAARLASTAQTLAYVSLAVMSVLCAALLLGILGRVIS